MQAAAAAFTVDALYAVLDDLVQVPQATKDAWTRNRTSRGKRLAEVIRLASILPTAECATLRTGLSTVFKYRDEAVHPASRFHAPLVHPDLRY